MKNLINSILSNLRKYLVLAVSLIKRERVNLNNINLFWRNINYSRMQKNIESLLLITLSNLLIPIVPFLIEIEYSNNHLLSQKTLVMGISMYCFSIAITSERRLFNFLLSFVGIMVVSLYGSYSSCDMVTNVFDFKIILMLSVFFCHLSERIILNLLENEKIKTFI